MLNLLIPERKYIYMHILISDIRIYLKSNSASYTYVMVIWRWRLFNAAYMQFLVFMYIAMFYGSFSSPFAEHMRIIRTYLQLSRHPHLQKRKQQ